MYDTFFNRLIQKKRKELTEVATGDLSYVENLQNHLKKIDHELANQQNLLESASKPSDRKEAEENINALKSTRLKLDKEISLKVSKIKIYDDDILVDLKKLYFSLKQHEDVSQIIIDEAETSMMIVTKYLIDRNTYIGAYIVKIYFELEGVRISRYDGKKYNGEFEHPFVHNEGVCFGNRSKEITKAMNQGGFYSIALICLELLKYTQSGAHGFVRFDKFRDWVIKQIPQRG